MSILSFLLCFLIAAFIVVALFDFVHTCIGAPQITEDGATYNGGFIFSSVGAWLAKQYMSEEQRNKAKLQDIANMAQFSHGEMNWARAVLGDGATDEQALKLLRANHLEALQTEDNFVNWFKPLGVCWYCTMFWFCTALGALLLFALSFAQTVGLSVWLLSLLHFAPLCIKIRQIIND